jgi:hypothetical protein
LWAAALGFLPSCPTAAGIWPHLTVEPTVGITSNVMPHDGKELLPPWGVTPDIYLSIFFDSTIYFPKIKAK